MHTEGKRSIGTTERQRSTEGQRSREKQRSTRTTEGQRSTGNTKGQTTWTTEGQRSTVEVAEVEEVIIDEVLEVVVVVEEGEGVSYVKYSNSKLTGGK